MTEAKAPGYSGPRGASLRRIPYLVLSRRSITRGVLILRVLRETAARARGLLTPGLVPAAVRARSVDARDLGHRGLGGRSDERGRDSDGEKDPLHHGIHPLLAEANTPTRVLPGRCYGLRRSG